jgi:hypothetical protein
MQNKDNKDKKIFDILNFSQNIELPRIKFNKGRNLVEWGSNNRYPDYLLDLYNFSGCSTHKSIINKKVKMLSGNGINSDELSDKVKQKLENESHKLFLDQEIFNGFALEVIFANDGSIYDVNHVHFSNVRKGYHNNQDKIIEEFGKSFFWISDDWKHYRKEEYTPKYIREYDENRRMGRSLIYFEEYNPYNSTEWSYPIADYSTSINYIEIDNEISKFHLDDIKSGFMQSLMINFADGDRDEEVKSEFYRDFNRRFKGSEGNKLFISYSDGKDNAPEILPFEANNSDERFIMLKDVVEENIVRGHEIPPQILITQPGKLSGTEQRGELLQEFNNTYIQPRQRKLSDIFSNLFGVEISFNSYTERVNDIKKVDENIESENRSVLRSTSAGVDTIINIQNNINSGILDYDQALYMLDTIFGYEQEEAMRLIKNNKKL